MHEQLKNEIKDDILGKKYLLSIALISAPKSRKINKKYRREDKPTNVLSFALRKNEGEILLCPEIIRKEAKNSDKTYAQFMLFLVIHGMLHLKGMKHSSTMEKAEKIFYNKYKKHDQKHFNRNRYGIPNNQSGGGRIYKGRKKS